MGRIVGNGGAGIRVGIYRRIRENRTGETQGGSKGANARRSPEVPRRGDVAHYRTPPEYSILGEAEKARGVIGFGLVI